MVHDTEPAREEDTDANRVSLAPLDAEAALRALLQVKPERDGSDDEIELGSENPAPDAEAQQRMSGS